MNAPHPSDEQLMGLVARGDEEAFVALYERLAPRALGMIRRLLHDRDEAEDVLQNVMWEVWQRAENYDRALATPATWVLMIARARALDHLRKRRRRGMVTEDAPADVPHDPVSAPELLVPIADAIAVIPPEQRRVLSLAYAYGLSRERIAEMEGIPVGTVKTRLRAAIRYLREQYEQAEVA